MSGSHEILYLQLVDACHLCRVEVSFFEALVAEGVFSARVATAQLEPSELALLRKAARLHLDLGINPPGIALVLELLERR